jgi:hypothetical protein
MTIEHFEPATKKQVAEILPLILRKTLLDYEQFMQEKTSTETKVFSQKQAAGKVAVSHIMLLLKLAKWAGIDKDLQGDSDYSRAIAIALKEVEKNRNLVRLMDEEDDEFEDD